MKTNMRNQPPLAGIPASALIVASWLAIVIVCPVHAQNYSLDWWTCESDGTSTGDIYTVTLTISTIEPEQASGGAYTVVVCGPYDGTVLDQIADLYSDADGDELTKLMEYALGTDPNNPGDSGNGLVSYVQVVDGSTYLSLSFKRRKAAAALGLQYVPEVSGDKVTWASDFLNVQEVYVQSVDPDFEWVTVQDLTPVSSTVTRFIRLRVIKP